MISSTGRKPRSAMPDATPNIDASLIGVVITRSGQRVDRPLRHLEGAAVGVEDVFAEQVDARVGASTREGRR